MSPARPLTLTCVPRCLLALGHPVFSSYFFYKSCLFCTLIYSDCLPVASSLPLFYTKIKKHFTMKAAGVSDFSLFVSIQTRLLFVLTALFSPEAEV